MRTALLLAAVAFASCTAAPQTESELVYEQLMEGGLARERPALAPLADRSEHDLIAYAMTFQHENWDSVVAILRRGEPKGWHDATYLAAAYSLGRPDSLAARATIRRLARLGHPQAMMALSSAYAAGGNGTRQDLDSAAYLHVRAEDAGSLQMRATLQKQRARWPAEMQARFETARAAHP